ncbi:unnamed protein product [Symbiodinium sp. CCMP2456]|nr:unnamed protein product [Symbiodinium sp. CCMP2456]
MPRIPAELLSSHQGGLQALGDAFHDVAGMDEVGAEFRRRVEIREQAKRLALESDSKEAIKRAVRTSSTPTRHWNQGQWVYVFRRGKPGDPLHPVSRWVGPGLVVLQTKSIVWVAMRTRLWRCAPEQLRPADPSEMMGRQLATDPALGELLRQVVSGTQARAIDVAREGPPPTSNEEADSAVHRVPDGPEVTEEVPINSTKHPWTSYQYLQVFYLLLESLKYPEDSRLSTNEESNEQPDSRKPLPLQPEREPREHLWSHYYKPYDEGDKLPERTSPLPFLNEALFQRDTLDESFSWFSYKAEQGWTLLANRNDEVDIKKLARDEQEMFLKSDAVEWEAILKTKAVRVATGAEAQRLRAKYPDRIVSSRMVRRKKPTGDLHQWKAKSRWCLHGHADPDTGQLLTFAPTPQAESMMLFLQCGLSLNHSFAFCVLSSPSLVKDSVSQPGALIVIEIPVYGLDDAPAAWRETRFLVEDMKFTRSLVEPCWFFRHNAVGHNEAQVLVEVDDFIVSTDPTIRDEVRSAFEARFKFGKWDRDQADYAGRRVRVLDDRILVDQDQEKYILEQLQPIHLAKGRRSAKDQKLLPDEFAAFRSMIYRISWVGKECRPEMCGLSSIMASRLDRATVDDALVVNRCVNHLRNTASRPLTIWKIQPSDLSFVIIDELGLPADATQGAWMVVASEGLPIGDQKVRASPISWRSSKLKREVYSTFGGETQAMLQGLAEGDWLQIMLRDALFGDVQLRDWRNSLSPHMLVMRSSIQVPERQPQCSVTDAKSLFDCLLKEHPQGRQDRRSALELAIIVKDLQETKSMVRWTPHQKMLVDALTKADPLRSNGAMDCFLKTGLLSLVDVETELRQRSEDVRFRRRSHSASAARLAQEYEAAHTAFWSTLNGGNCSEDPLVIGVLS